MSSAQASATAGPHTNEEHDSATFKTAPVAELAEPHSLSDAHVEREADQLMFAQILRNAHAELELAHAELELAHEELRATNDELRSVNQQAIAQSLEGARLADDLSNVLGGLAIPIVILDRDAHVRRFTPAAGVLFRILAEDLGRPIAHLRSRLLVPDLPHLLSDVLQHQCVVERTVQDEDGRWYQLTVRPYLTADRRLDGITLTAFDVNALKRAQQDVGRARVYAESVIDTVSDCLLVVDRALCVRCANRAFYEAFRMTSHETEGRPFILPVKSGGGAASLAERFLALTEGEAFHDVRETLMLRHDGERTFTLSGRHIEKTPWFLLVLRDITEQIESERVKRRQEIEFQEVLEAASEGVLMTDGAGRILFANRIAASLFGYPRDEMTGLSIDTLVPDQVLAEHGQALAAAAPRALGRSRTLDGRRKDGSLFPAELLVNVVQREEGPLVISFVTDISARREAERRLLDSQERLQQLAFERAVAEERERRKIAGDLHDRIGQALALAQIKLTGARSELSGPGRAAVDDAVELLAQSLLDTRTLIFELSPPVLYDLGLNAALTWLAEQVEREHGVHVEISDDGLAVPLEEMALALVFRAVRELLLNVVKHAKTTRATVTLSRTKNHFEICVEDFGVGFALETSSTGPRGYGLFSVREQIRPLGGSLGLESAPQKGTRVQLRIPLPAPPASAEEAASRARRVVGP